MKKNKKQIKVSITNNLAYVNPELAKQWHSTLNEDLTPYDVTPGSNKFAWWQCDKSSDHEWSAQVRRRNAGTGCPACRGLMVVMSNCLATTHPKIAAQWHRTKNPDESPYTVTAGSDIKVWWKCKNGHEWESRINNRKQGRGCPSCLILK